VTGDELAFHEVCHPLGAIACRVRLTRDYHPRHLPPMEFRLLRRSTPLLVCPPYFMWAPPTGFKEQDTSVGLLRADRQAGLASTRRRPPLDAAAVRDRSLARCVTYPLVGCSRPEPFLACSKRVTHLTCSEEPG